MCYLAGHGLALTIQSAHWVTEILLFNVWCVSASSRQHKSMAKWQNSHGCLTAAAHHAHVSGQAELEAPGSTQVINLFVGVSGSRDLALRGADLLLSWLKDLGGGTLKMT